MKNYYLLLLLLIGFFGKAQIITIPDANFKAKLLAASPSNSIAQNSAFTNLKIDTNNDGEIQQSETLQVAILNLNNSNISSLEGINSFSNLTKLNCYNNQLTNLDVTSLTNLARLYCYNNQLISLNVSGLINLEYLVCSYNQLSNLDVTGLINLEYLSCTYNQLSSIYMNGLVNLSSLYCDNNQISTLNITGLVNLLTLSCPYNQLSSIDFSGMVNLFNVNCKFNQISNLNFSVVMPNLQELDCKNNNLLILDASYLHNIINLNCNNNQLTSLFIKNGRNENISIFNNPNLVYVCADESQITDILNLNPSLNVNSYCSFTPGGQFYTIQGQQKFDNENDGCDVTDNFIPNLKFNITSGTTTGQLISNNSGIYLIPLQSGSHTVTPILENPSYFNVSPNNVVVDFPTQASPFTQNFCITPNGEIHDVEISILPLNPVRPGFDCNYKIVYKNKGNQIENGTINLAFNDAFLDFVSSSVATLSQTFGNLNWNYSNLQPFETRTINVVLNLNSPMETPAVNAGDVLNLTTTITTPGEIPCSNNWLLSECDNIFSLNQIVVNSYDPNDKTCLEGNYIGPDRVGGFVHYMIRFENTGTFPAENIVVKDMIDTAKFDVSSLVPLHASHNYFTRITGNKVEFIFENINLPFNDANNDGYVAFKIKTLPSLVAGNTFSNSANIYFDYNFPIVTNTATTTIAALNNPSFEFADYFSLYPNPTKSEININLKSAIEINSIQIYNTIGQLVTLQTGNALKVDVSHLKPGNYFIKINTIEGFTTGQFIKE